MCLFVDKLVKYTVWILNMYFNLQGHLKFKPFFNVFQKEPYVLSFVGKSPLNKE